MKASSNEVEANRRELITAGEGKPL